MMQFTTFLVLCGLLTIQAIHIDLGFGIYVDEIIPPHPFADEIEKINALDTTWKAGKQKRFEGMSESDVKKLCGVLPYYGPPLPTKEIKAAEDIPDTFDARTKWPDCQGIAEIRDQSNCGSCWAFGAVEAMSDRYCIHMKKTYEISAANLMDCCEACGSGCDGGYPPVAWRYWVETGIVTGGLYDNSTTEAKTCQPYPLPSCDHHEAGKESPCSKQIAHTPHCTKTCHAGYSNPYSEDVHHGESAYGVSGVEKIQTEIMTNGPVEASFTVYSDFPTYRSGVYKKHSFQALGGHAVRILGWGTEDSTPYWLVANSWNPDWGDNGYFKIVRGKDECGIESGIMAGMPKD